MVRYKLDLFIKHKSKTEFGQGNFVSFPITIRNGKSTEIPHLRELQQTLLFNMAPHFEPQTVWPHVICEICLNGDSGMIEAVTKTEDGKTVVMMPSSSEVYHTPVYSQSSETYDPLNPSTEPESTYNPYAQQFEENDGSQQKLE